MAKKTDSKKLEEALDKSDSAASEISKEEETGYHKGALTTLANERVELIKMVQVVEQLMQAHMKRLEELGVKLPKK